MGKIRVKTFGEGESKQEEKRKRERQAKKAAKTTALKGSEPVAEQAPMVSVSASSAPKEPKTKKIRTDEKRKKSRKYNQNKTLLKPRVSYPVEEAVKILKRFQKAKFDETVELHLNMKEKAVSGQMVLPHGTGKKLRIRIADDLLLESIGKGIIDFDVLIAPPVMMSKLGKVARILGPRGLMPNVKNGTVTDTPEAVIKKLNSGQVNFKTEAQAPLLHFAVGKVSFEDTKLKENIEAVFKSLGQEKIQKATLKSTMSPGIRLQVVTG